MYYQASLQFILGTLKKCGIPTYTVTPDTGIHDRSPLSLQLLFNGDLSIQQLLQSAEPATVYSFSDPFSRNYIYFRLPDTSSSLLIIGPYLQERPSEQIFLGFAEQFQLSPKSLQELRRHINSVVLLADDSPVHHMLEQFYEVVWGAGGYRAVNATFLHDMTMLPDKPVSNEDNLWNAQLLEQRYAMENNMLSAVAMGQLQKAERGFARFSPDQLEERTPDMLRNTKNYCIIMNTLLRKAAEHGGVHPSFIDRVSTDFAIRIEKLPSVSNAGSLMKDMIRAYCHLVQNQRTSGYAAPVQKAILLIDSDLSADLSLHRIAEKLSVSGSYLSNLFKKETGQTITAYIINRRIKLAKHLLRTTGLQIQTIAQHCGFPDVNYFSKTFKKLTAVTPKAYREGP